DGVVLRFADAALDLGVAAPRGDAITVLVDGVADILAGQRAEAAERDVDLAAAQRRQRQVRREVGDGELGAGRFAAEGADQVGADQRGDELGRRDGGAAGAWPRGESRLAGARAGHAA